jgi:predicted RND superfamily exporter protein
MATRVRTETDILSLVPEHNRIVQDFKTTVERFGTVDTLLVVVRLDPEQSMEPALAFADILAEQLRGWELIEWLGYRIEDTAQSAVPLLDRATLFLEPDELDDLLARLEPENLPQEAQRLRAELMAPQSLVTKELLRIDPLGLLPRILKRVRFQGFGAGIDPETGCLIDSGRTMLLMLARPTRPAQDLRFDQELVAGLGERVRVAEATWREDGWDGPPPAVEFTGGYIIALSDSQLIIRDAVVGLVSSLVGVMALFLLAFRRRAALLYAFLPLVTGLGLTLIFAAFALGRLNSLTSACGGLLIGLGIDFIIVLYGRYVEERVAGTSHDGAIDAAGRNTGVGVLLGAVTTAATFFAFLVTDFRGLWELGLLTGAGILLLVVTVFLLLPALLTLLQGRFSRHKGLYLRSFGSDLLCRASLRRPTVTLVLTAIVTAGFAVAMKDLEFDDDIRNMRSPDNRGTQLRLEVMETFGLRFSPMMIRLDGVSEAEVFERARLLLPELQRLQDEEVLASIDTIAAIVPPIDEQRMVIERLARAQTEDLEERFGLALRGAGLSPSAFNEGIGHLMQALRVDRPLELHDLEGTALEPVVNRYIVHDDEGVSTAIYCYPPAGMWRREAPREMKELVARFPDTMLAGTNVVSAELRRIVWGDAARAAVIGLVLVFALMWADLGSPLRSALALVPLIIGMVWMLGAMAMLGIQVNFMNIFVLTMIIGIGVDYGVHLLHRWDESEGGEQAVAETAKAIAVAALTTMVGFGSLVLSHFPGLRSVGAAAIIGALSTAVLSMTLLPVLLAVAKSRGLAVRSEGGDGE